MEELSLVDLVEISSEKIVIPAELTNISAVQLFENAKITPYRVQNLPDGKRIYEFWRVDSKKEVSLRDKKHKKELAMVVISGDRQSFDLHYYPIDKNIQIIEKLNVDKLREIASNLKDAGFR